MRILCFGYLLSPRDISQMLCLFLAITFEILKYYSNTYNALRVTFANVMYEVCDQLNSNYSKVLDTFLLRNINNSDYLICEPDLRGYGGMCLPKDTRAMAELCHRLNLPFNLFKTIDHDNSQIKSTVFPGMRE